MAIGKFSCIMHSARPTCMQYAILLQHKLGLSFWDQKKLNILTFTIDQT